MATTAVTKITVSSTDVRLRASVSVVDPAVEVSRVIPVTEISYIYLQVLASLDSTGLFRYITDSAVVSDGEAFSLTKVLRDTVTPSDAVTRSTAKSVADVFSLLDDVVATLVFLRDFTETQTIDDFFASAFTKVISDSVTVEDLDSIEITKLLADGFTMIDSSQVTDGITYSFSASEVDAVTSSDSSFRSFVKTRTDSISLTDSGFVLQQDYVDMTYFSEDYVGVGYIF
jgi:hypothetical protein